MIKEKVSHVTESLMNKNNSFISITNWPSVSATLETLPPSASTRSGHTGEAGQAFTFPGRGAAATFF